MLKDTSKKKKGGYTIDHTGVDPDGGTSARDESPLSQSDLDKVATILPAEIRNVQYKLKKKFLENPEPPIDKPKEVLPKVRKPRKPRVLPRHRAIMSRITNKGELISKAMVALSYSEKSPPQAIIHTKSWQMLMDEHMPEDLIALRHTELLNKRARRNIKDKDGKVIEYDVDDGPDTPAVVKALELAYKLRGSFAAEKKAPDGNVIYNLFYKPEVREAMKSFEDNLKQQIANEANKNIKDAVYEVPGDFGRKNKEE